MRPRRDASMSATRVQEMDETRLPQFNDEPEEMAEPEFRKEIIRTTEASLDKTFVNPSFINQSATGVHYQSP